MYTVLFSSSSIDVEVTSTESSRKYRRSPQNLLDDIIRIERKIKQGKANGVSDFALEGLTELRAERKEEIEDRRRSSRKRHSTLSSLNLFDIFVEVDKQA